MAEWLANGRQLTTSADLTVAELMVRYLAHVDARYTSSEPAKIRLALRPVLQLYGMTPAREFGPLALRIWNLLRLILHFGGSIGEYHLKLLCDRHLWRDFLRSRHLL